jgi:hypothetical protein
MKAGNEVSPSLFLSKKLGGIPIKIKNSSGVTTTGTSSVPTGPPVLVSLTYTGSNYMPCPKDPNSGRRSMTMTIIATFNKPIVSLSANPVGNFTVNGNTATVVVPNDRCTDSTNQTVPVIFTVDGVYTVTGSLFIPANT